MKFKKGDKIVVDDYCKGFDEAIVTGIIKKNGKQYYTLKIMNGTATIPMTAEINYRLAEKQ